MPQPSPRRAAFTIPFVGYLGSLLFVALFGVPIVARFFVRAAHSAGPDTPWVSPSLWFWISASLTVAFAIAANDRDAASSSPRRLAHNLALVAAFGCRAIPATVSLLVIRTFPLAFASGSDASGEVPGRWPWSFPPVWLSAVPPTVLKPCAAHNESNQ